MTAIANVYYEQTTNQTRTGATTFANISGAQIPSSDFVVGQKYLILVSAQMSGSVSSNNFRLRLAHGGTAFADSEYSVQPNLAATRMPYFYFTVWTAVSSENIDLQHATDNSGSTVNTDQITMFAMRLDDDLTENTDWFYNENTTSNALGTTFEDGASVTFTPATASHLWLLLYRHQRTASAVTSQGESRADLSGGTSGNWGLWSVEGELAANDIHFSSFARAISLPASSHTFKAQGRSESADVFTHLRSAVFALDLGMFKDSSQVFTATAAGYGTSEFGTNIQTLSHTKTVDGNVLIIVSNVDDLAATTTTADHRLQVDNTDQPDTQTSDSYPTSPANNDSTDQGAFHIFTRENITANITIDHDGHSNVATTPTYSDRAIVCFSMELAGAGSTTVTPSAVTAVFAVNAPSIVKGALTKTPSAVVATFATFTPNVSNGLTLVPSAVAASFGIFAPVVVVGTRTLTPTAVSAIFGIPAPTLLEGPVVIQPSPDVAQWIVAVPTVVSGGGGGPAVSNRAPGMIQSSSSSSGFGIVLFLLSSLEYIN